MTGLPVPAIDEIASAWASERRRAALEAFETLGLPSTKLEDWKYTNVAAIERAEFGTPARATAVPPSVRDIDPLDEESIELVFVDGHFRADLSRPGAPRPGVSVTSFAEALRDSAGPSEPFLARIAPLEANGFVAWNTAAFADGALVILSEGAVLDQPIHISFADSAGEGLPVAAHPRALVIAGPGSRASLVETHVGGAGATLSNAVTEIDLGAGAELEHTVVQRRDLEAFYVHGIWARQARESHYTSRVVSLGGALARTDLVISQEGEGARSTLEGLYLVTGTQHVDHHTTVDHRAPNGTSRETYKGILDGRGTGVFNGKVVIREGAQGTDAGQTNRNLLLSKQATIDTKPELEIFADDVRCAHGATIGRLDEDALFYVRSRGISAEAARSLLIHAFASELIRRVPIEGLRWQLERDLWARFGWELEKGLEL